MKQTLKSGTSKSHFHLSPGRSKNLQNAVASMSYKVTGIDLLDEPINRARQEAGERAVTATYFIDLDVDDVGVAAHGAIHTSVSDKAG